VDDRDIRRYPTRLRRDLFDPRLLANQRDAAIKRTRRRARADNDLFRRVISAHSVDCDADVSIVQ
jgi:hypothetical protein